MLIEGTIFRGNSGNYSVRPRGGGPDYIVKLRGNLKKELEYSTSISNPRRVTRARKRRATDPVTVGDHVLIDTELGMIEKVLPRKSELARMTPSGREQHVLVANLDIVFIVFAAANPLPDPWLLDRFLLLAESAELSPAIVVNKCDMAGDMISTRAFFGIYEKIGYDILYTAAKKREGIEELRAALIGKISAFTGPSGVGKSSLLNVLQPGLLLKTALADEVTACGSPHDDPRGIDTDGVWSRYLGRGYAWTQIARLLADRPRRCRTLLPGTRALPWQLSILELQA